MSATQPVTDDDLFMRFMLTKDKELLACYRQMDSVENLNSNPMAIRFAGLKAARISFVLGYRHAESALQPK